VQDKWALEEHLSTAENNQLWDDSGEAARNGKVYMDYVESHLLDADERLRIMDATGIERTIVSLTAPGIQSITDAALAVKVARDTNNLTKSKFTGPHPGRLSMFACLPTHDGTQAAAELRRAVGELGAAGALINGYTHHERSRRLVRRFPPVPQRRAQDRPGQRPPAFLPHRLNRQPGPARGNSHRSQRSGGAAGFCVAAAAASASALHAETSGAAR
jgi:Amidohydrolase